ncbi:Spc98 family-domain-containing protein, partial [Ochromonadaceae sp. CCMP2298]
ELLEAAVEAVYDVISSRLWALLRIRFGFCGFLHVIRNTYLLGKGELFQSLLDGVVAQTHKPAPMDGKGVERQLQWVMRETSKLVGIDDESLGGMLSLSVNSPELVADLRRQELWGAAGRGGAEAPSPQQQFAGVWGYLRRKAVGTVARNEVRTVHRLGGGGGGGGANTSMGVGAGGDEYVSDMEEESPTPFPAPTSTPTTSTSTPTYIQGGLWLQDRKHITRGFSLSATFAPTWPALTPTHALFSLSHPFSHPQSFQFSHLQRRGCKFPPVGARVLQLGSFSFLLRGDKRAPGGGVGGGIGMRGGEGCLVVGASFHAVALPGEGRVRYFARTFLRRGGRAVGVGVGVGIGLGLGLGMGMGASALGLGSVGGTGGMGMGSNGGMGMGSIGGMESMGDSGGDEVLSQEIVDIDSNLAGMGLDPIIGRSVSSGAVLCLQVQYVRSMARAGGARLLEAAVGGAGTGVGMGAEGMGAVGAGMDAGVGAGMGMEEREGGSWDVQLPLDLSVHVKCQGGQACVGAAAWGIVFPTHSHSSSEHGCGYSGEGKDGEGEGGEGEGGYGGEHGLEAELSAPPRSFCFHLLDLRFAGKGALLTYPVASPYTFSRFPDSFARIQSEVGKLRAWMGLQLKLSFPPTFHVIFDAEAVAVYERVCAAIMRVRLVGHALERLWIRTGTQGGGQGAQGGAQGGDRSYCQLRHSMHFFVSNLLYYLQVDVVDSEYAQLLREVEGAADFQAVLRAHRGFLSAILRLSLVDNVAVQEGIERVLQICLRFLAVSRILQQVGQGEDEDEGMGWGSGRAPSRGGAGGLSRGDPSTAGGNAAPRLPPRPIFVPPQEMQYIRADFFAQVALLLQGMRRVESRGCVFRLDFNSYLSNAALQQAQTQTQTQTQTQAQSGRFAY